MAVKGRRPDILPEDTVRQVIRDARNEWLGQPEQQQSFNELTPHMTRGNAKRTMTSRFRTMLREKYGGDLWFKVLISTGSIPPLFLELANAQVATGTLERKHIAPASSRGPASAASAGKPTGSHHVVSLPKRQRNNANKLMKAVRAESDMQSSYCDNNSKRKSPEEFAQMQAEAERARWRASESSRASGHAYKMNGEAHGAPETSKFAILLTDYCGQMHINVATGFLELSHQSNR